MITLRRLEELNIPGMARGFWPLARRERGAYPQGSVTSEQRGQRPKEPARPGIFSFSERLRTILLLAVTAAFTWAGAAHGAVAHDPGKKLVFMTDEAGHLALRLNYAGKCMLDQVVVRGGEVVPPETGVCSAIKVGNQWHTTRVGLPSPTVTVSGSTVTVEDIRFGGGGIEVTEAWQFAVEAGRIVWRIERTYHSGGTLEDTYFPGWDFNDLKTWTGALLGHGGVAWTKLFDSPHASYGVHAGPVTFWNRDKRACLRITPSVASPKQLALRFTRQPSGILSFNYSVTDRDLAPKHGHSRFLHGAQDLWAPFSVAPSKLSVEYSLAALDYDAAYDRAHSPILMAGPSGRSATPSRGSERWTNTSTAAMGITATVPCCTNRGSPSSAWRLTIPPTFGPTRTRWTSSVNTLSALMAG